jgi:hypothetical protein
MSGLRSNQWRVAVVPLLILAALLLPTLHLHPVHGHDHEKQSHQHTVIHADFFSVSVHDQHHSHTEDVALGDSIPATFSQSSLSALLTRNLDSLLTSLEKSPEFLLVDIAVAHGRQVLFTPVLKRDHPPPLRPVFVAPNSPRSPPSFG